MEYISHTKKHETQERERKGQMLAFMPMRAVTINQSVGRRGHRLGPGSERLAIVSDCQHSTALSLSYGLVPRSMIRNQQKFDKRAPLAVCAAVAQRMEQHYRYDVIFKFTPYSPICEDL